MLRISFWYVSFNTIVKICILVTIRLANFLLQVGHFSYLFYFIKAGKKRIAIESLFWLYMRVSGQFFVVIRF